jgi:hypothetical protein
MIMNHNPDKLPKDCKEISKDVDITIRGGHKFVKGSVELSNKIKSNRVFILICLTQTANNKYE